MLPQPLWGREIDRPAEDFGKPFTQSDEPEEIRRLLELDEDVDVAIRPGFVARDGAEHAQPAHARASKFRAVSGNAIEELCACQRSGSRMLT